MKKRTARTSIARPRRTVRPDADPPMTFPDGLPRRIQILLPQLDLVRSFLIKHEVEPQGGAYRGAALLVEDVRFTIAQCWAVFNEIKARQDLNDGAK